MYVARVPNRGSPPAILLRESYREGGQVKNRTLANLSRGPTKRSTRSVSMVVDQVRYASYQSRPDPVVLLLTQVLGHLRIQRVSSTYFVNWLSSPFGPTSSTRCLFAYARVNNGIEWVRHH